MKVCNAYLEEWNGCVYSDAYLSYWGDVYVANRAILEDRGVVFETFLTDPRAILEAVLFCKPLPLSEGEDFYPLLPSQKAVQERLINADLDEWLRDELERNLTRITPTGKTPVRRADGQIIEPLKHHSYPQKRGNWYKFRATRC
ncbi:MAG: hypothetical protein KZQ94_22305 [Candidatus Thiodiazotropha sp. (ex Troendleina suluensis)]|nr:hypothetical protein [Candidatus Thiodiazotropha sp. (ex Troendleina suluensis)]